MAASFEEYDLAVKNKDGAKSCADSELDVGDSVLQKKGYHEPCTLKPSSPRQQRWDIFIIVLLFFTATVTPFEVRRQRPLDLRAERRGSLCLAAPCVPLL